MVAAMGQVVEVLLNSYFLMKWTIRESTGEPFMTSDCPVHRYYPSNCTMLPDSGLADPHVEVHFPLSRRRMLVLCHDEPKVQRVTDLAKRGRTREADKLRRRASEISVKAANAEEVNELNAHTISNGLQMGIFSKRGQPYSCSI